MDILTILINNGVGVACAAAMLWLSWFRETKTIPAMLTAFNMAHERGTTALSNCTTDMQTQFAIRNQRALDTFSQLVREERELYQKLHDDNTARIDAVRDRTEVLAMEIKENRHLLRELVHEAKLRNEAKALGMPGPRNAKGE